MSGILLFVHCRFLPPAAWTLLILPLLVCLFRRNPVIRLSGCVAIGFLWALLHAGIILHEELDPDLEGRTLHVTGRVVSLPESRPQRIRFEFAVDKLLDAEGNKRCSPGKVRLNWYRSPVMPAPGQVWQLSIRLKRPHGFMNPGGFDYERWLFLKRIRATGYVVDKEDNKYTGVTSGQWLDRLRYSLRRQMAGLVPDRKSLGLLTALGLGDRSLLSRDRMTTLIRTGTSHLLAISGLHIGLVAMIIFAAVRRLWSVGGKLPLFLGSPQAATAAAILTACAYALLAGFTVPTQRAMLMVAIVLFSLLSSRRYPVSRVLGASMFAVLLLDPFAVLDPGFWLSFTAVGIIVYGMTCRFGPRNLYWRWGRVQVLITAGLIPLLLAWFQQFSLLGIPANLVAVPWVSLLVVPLTLTGTLLMTVSTTLAGILLALAGQALALLWPFLDLLADSRFAVWQQGSPPMWVLAASLAGILILLQPGGLPGRWLGLVWLLPLFFPLQSRPAAGSVWLTVLDVGQGLAGVVQTRNHTMLYDTGARFSRDFNAGDAVVLPFLRQRGVQKLDLLVVSHGDNDHIGGADAVLESFPHTPVLTSVPSKLASYRPRTCQRGMSWVWDGIRFSVLHPLSGSHFRDNNRSCVIEVTTGRQTLLLTGDIEKAAEMQLLEKYGDKLDANVLVVPHHGSKTSSIPAFIHAVNPEWAIIAAGYHNRFNLPNQDIIERYQQNDSMILNTSRLGAINVRFNQPGIEVEWYRQSARRFWHTY